VCVHEDLDGRVLFALAAGPQGPIPTAGRIPTPVGGDIVPGQVISSLLLAIVF